MSLLGAVCLVMVVDCSTETSLAAASRNGARLESFVLAPIVQRFEVGGSWTKK